MLAYLNQAFADQKDIYFLKYIELINNCKTKTYDETIIYNYHHIIPKIWYKLNKLKIDNSAENLIKMSIYDHIVAHYYLMKYYDRTKQIYLRNCMAGAINVLSGQNCSSDNILKIALSNDISELNINIDEIYEIKRYAYEEGAKRLKHWRDTANEQSKQNAVNKLKKYWQDDDRRKEASIKSKNAWENLSESEKQAKINNLIYEQQKYRNSLSPEELKRFNTVAYKMTSEQHREAAIKAGQTLKKQWETKTEQEKDDWSNKIRKAIMEDMDKTAYENMRKKQGESKRKNWESKTKNEQDALMQPMHDGAKKWWNQFSAEEKSEKLKEHAKKISPEVRKMRGEKMRLAAKNKLNQMSPEEKRRMFAEISKKTAQANRGKIWVVNPKTSEMHFINKDQEQKYIDLGYVRGRIKRKK